MELNRTTNCVVRVARLKAEELNDNAQEAANNLETANNLFRNKIKAKDYAVQDRDMATNNRIELANSIYAELGSGIWAERNEAKYNDYVIKQSK